MRGRHVVDIRSSLPLWIRVWRHPLQALMVDPVFLDSALSPDPERHAHDLWTFFRPLRALAIVGVMLRFGLNREDYNTPNWQWAVLMGVGTFVFVEFIALRRPYDDYDTTAPRARVLLIAETLCIGALCVLTRRPESDLYLLLMMPMAMAVAFLPGAEALWYIPASLLTLFAASYLAGQLPVPDSDVHRSWLGLLGHVFIIRATVLCALELIGLHFLKFVAAERAIWASLMGAMPEGLAIVGQHDWRIKWANDVLKQQCYPGRDLVGNKCHVAYNGRSSVCDVCPTKMAFKGEIDQQVTRSPEYVVQGRTLTPEKRWRRFDERSAPISFSGQVVAALQCVRDITCREVLHEATKALQAAGTEKEILGAIADAIVALGYQRCRIYLMSSDERYFVGRHHIGMDGEDFVGWKLPWLGEPYSEETSRSSAPKVYRAPLADQFRKPLGKEPGMPWIEVPLKLGQRLYGKISIDNKGHPLPERWGLEDELSARDRSTPLQVLEVLHSLGVQASFAIKQTRAQAAMADTLTAYVHFCIGLFGMVLQSASDLYYSNGEQSSEKRDQAYMSIDEVARSLQRFGTLVMNWGDLLQDMNLNVEPQPSQLDVAQVVRQVWEWCRRLAEDARCTISIEPDSLPAELDRSILEQIVFVLLTNALHAIKHRDEPHDAGQIHASLRREGLEIVIDLRDNGPGIAPHIRDILFIPGARGANYQGLGVGLFVANRLAEAHGGQVVPVRSDPGLGAEFRVSLREPSREGCVTVTGR